MKFTEYLAHISYRIFGRILPVSDALRNVYLKSGLLQMYEMYVALALFISLVSFASTFVVAFLVHYVLFHMFLLQSVAASLALSFVVFTMALTMFLAYPLYCKSQRRQEIDANLIYTAGYMGVLSAGGGSIERIFDRVIQVEQRRSIRDLAKRFVGNVRIFGLDVVSSLNDVVAHSSSDVFGKLLVSMANTIQTSGDLKSLLGFETERLLAVKREQLKKTLATLIALSEVYVTAMIMAPITFIVMLTILSILGSATFGLSPAAQMNLLVFFGIPAICLIFIVLLNGVLPEEE